MMDSADPSTRRRQFMRAIGIAGAAGLAGCSVNTGSESSSGGGSSGDGSSSDGSTGSGATAQAATGWAWNIAAKALNGAAETYNSQNDTEVTVKELGRNTWEQRFQTSVTSGSGAPDFSAIQNYDVTSYGAKDGLKDLTDRIKATDAESKIIDGKWQTVSVDGNYYAFPWDVGPTGVYFKRSAYEEAGIDAMSIETWDDFIEAGQKLDEDTAMFNLPNDELSQLWRMLLRQLGGQAFTESGAININSQESLRVARLLKKMKDAGITTNTGMWSSSWFTQFAENSLISLPSAAWMDGTLRAELPDTAGDWGVFKLPAFEKGGNRASNRGGSNLAIPSQISGEGTIDRAFDYIHWAMTQPEVQNKMLEEYGLFPSLTTAYDADVYDQELEFYDGQPIFRLFAEVAQEIEPYRYTTDTPTVQNAINTELSGMLNGEKSPKEAVDAAAETVADRTGRDLA